MLKKILIALAAVVILFLGYVAFVKPANISVVRSATLAVSPEAVFPHVNNFRKWDDWSPWAKRDPNAKTSYEGPEAGKGAVFNWDGNSKVGKGKMTIIESQPNEKIKIKLDFGQPFESTSDVVFTFTPDGDNTNVTWAMSSEQGFIGRAICTLMMVDVDAMIGADYEKGLANLKAIVEKPAG